MLTKISKFDTQREMDFIIQQSIIQQRLLIWLCVSSEQQQSYKAKFQHDQLKMRHYSAK